MQDNQIARTHQETLPVVHGSGSFYLGQSIRSDCMNQFECVVPIPNVKNFAASMDYYIKKLGFCQEMGLGHSADIWVCYTGQGRDFSL
jgi:hypothetical protein